MLRKIIISLILLIVIFIIGCGPIEVPFCGNNLCEFGEQKTCQQDCGITSEPKCWDSDGGKDYYEKGTVDYYEDNMDSTFTDNCRYQSIDPERKTLDEGYCEGNRFRFEPHECPNGCRDGACIQQTRSICAVQKEKETHTYTLEGKEYKVTTVSLGGGTQRTHKPVALMNINGVLYVTDGRSLQLSDGSNTLYIKSIEANEVLDATPDLIEFVLDDQRIVLGEGDTKTFSIGGRDYEISVITIADTGGTSEAAEFSDILVDSLIQEGETKVFTIEGNEYEVWVSTITDTDPYRIKLKINDETTEILEAGDIYILSNYMKVGISILLANEAGENTQDIARVVLGRNLYKTKDAVVTKPSIIERPRLAKFNVNTLYTDAIGEGESTILLDGSNLQVKTIELVEPGDPYGSRVEFCIYADISTSTE